MVTELDVNALIKAAERLLYDELGIIRTATKVEVPFQEIDVNGNTYQLSVVLRYKPIVVSENGEMSQPNTG